MTTVACRQASIPTTHGAHAKAARAAAGHGWPSSLRPRRPMPYVWEDARITAGFPAVGDAIPALWRGPVLVSRPGEAGTQGGRGPGSFVQEATAGTDWGSFSATIGGSACAATATRSRSPSRTTTAGRSSRTWSRSTARTAQPPTQRRGRMTAALGSRFRATSTAICLCRARSSRGTWRRTSSRPIRWRPGFFDGAINIRRIF